MPAGTGFAAFSRLEIQGRQHGQWGKPMGMPVSYENKMVLRLALPGLAATGVTCFLVWVTSIFAGIAIAPGGSPLLPDVSGYMALAGVVVCLVAFGIPSFRLWRWTRGEAEACFVCGCLLGSARQRRYSRCRQCAWGAKNITQWMPVD